MYTQEQRGIYRSLASYLLQSSQELPCGCLRLHLTVQDALKCSAWAIDFMHGVLIDGYFRAPEVRTGVGSAGTRIRKDWRRPAGVLAYSRTATSWACSNSFCPEIPMAIHKFLFSLIVHQQNDVLMFPPGLQTYTATADADERWRAPARISPQLTTPLPCIPPTINPALVSP